MAHRMVRVRHADFRIGTTADFARQHQGVDAGQVGLRRQYHQVDHHLGMVGEIVRNARGAGIVGQGRNIGAALFDLLDAALDVADRGQIFVQLLPVIGAHGAGHAAGIVGDEIQDAGLALQAHHTSLGVQAVAVAKQPLEDFARIDGDGQRGGLVAPGQGVGIGTAVASVAAAHQAGRLQAHFQRGDLGEFGELLGHHLVHRNAVGQVGAFSLLDVHAGQVSAAAAAVIASAVAQGFGLAMVQIADDLEFLAIRFQRLEDRRHLIIRACLGRNPVLHLHAVGGIDDVQPLADLGRQFGRDAAGRHHCVHQRQRQGGAGPAEQVAAIHGFARDDHFSGVLLMTKGAL